MFSYTEPWRQCLISIHHDVIHDWNPQVIKTGPTVRLNHWKKISWVLLHDIMLLVYRRARPVGWWRTEYTIEHKCAEDNPLHTTELASHTTTAICFDSQACLQIPFFTFEYSLQLLALPNVCPTITKNNASITSVPLTHKCTKSACFGAKSTRSRTAILSATCPVVCCTMPACVQVVSVVWNVLVSSVQRNYVVQTTLSTLKTGSTELSGLGCTLKM